MIDLNLKYTFFVNLVKNLEFFVVKFLPQSSQSKITKFSKNDFSFQISNLEFKII